MSGPPLLPPHLISSHAVPVQSAVVPLQKQVLVLGARGRLGYACVQAFARQGWRVLAHVRSRSGLLQHDSASTAQVRWINTGLQDAQQLQTLLAQQGQVDVVINAMAPQFSVSEWKSKLAGLNQLGIDVALQAQALLMQAISVLPYGHDLPAVLHEGQSIPGEVTPQISALRVQTELQLQAAAREGVRICTLRLGTLYGHSGWGWISTAVAKNVHQGVFDWLGPYDVATPWAYAPDVAKTIERIAAQAPLLERYTALHFAGHLRTGADWLQATQLACHAFGWLQPHQSLRASQVQWWMWKPAGWFSPVIRALGQMQYVWRTPHQLDNTQLRALIGQEPHTPWQEAVEQTLAMLDGSDDLHGGLVRTHQAY